MRKYNFIKISNNNNAAVDFMIDITTMTDTRLRISTLKSQYKKYLDKNDNYTCNFKDAWRYFDLDYSFYCIDTKFFDTYEQAKEHRLDLMDSEYERMNPNEK